MSKREIDIQPESSKKGKAKTNEDIPDFAVIARPGYGRLGQPVMLKTNHLRIENFPDRIIHHYTFLCDPVVKKVAAFTIFSKMRADGVFGDIRPIFDGNSSIFSPAPLPIKVDNSTFEVKLDANSEINARAKTFKVTIHKNEHGEISMQPLKQYMNGQIGLTQQVANSMLALNTILNAEARDKFPNVKRGIFPDQERMFRLHGGIQLRFGFSQTIHPGTDHLYVNVDVCVSTFFPSGPLLEVIGALFGRNREELHRGFGWQQKGTLENLLRGIQFRITHRGGSRRKFKIEKLSNHAAQDIKFTDKNGREISVANHFLEQYKRDLEFKDLFCVIVKNNVNFPLEVCEVLPGQVFTKDLTDTGKADMIKLTAAKPFERFKKIEDGINTYLQFNNNNDLQAVGIQVSKHMAVVEGRMLASPKLAYTKVEIEPLNGRWSIRNLKFPKCQSLANWIMIVLAELSENKLRNFVGELTETMRNQGMEIKNDRPPTYFGNNVRNVSEMMHNYYSQHNSSNNPLQLIVMIMPKRTSQLYGEIKKVSDIELGVPSQCIIADRLNKPRNFSTWTNISMKINSKLGGCNLYLPKSSLPNSIESKPTMIMGADLSHPSFGSNKPSIAAVTASMGYSYTKYYGRVSQNTPRDEKIDNLTEMTTSLLEAFKNQNQGHLPHQIIYYRDGVSEGQFRAILHHEITHMRKAFGQLYPTGKSPKLTFIIAQKRHRTRFMPENKKYGDKAGNPVAGTVVDREITHKCEFDFYLQSHSGLQGTTRPVHYFVLHDENKFTADDVQTMTYFFSYLYQKCTSSISIVPPLAYADLLANRTRLYPGNENNEQVIPDLHENLHQSMYFA
ncbi:572_t:CDS:10 [Ambispora gerdemannii]|uniref:572_t:CDS:1 n=1 Tax=Ambispora gerdemannii TaxID=144530 RepID=A0A9N9EZ70_9GLOM|nr:572_t:CDS:10 [Ambispora gerdemannii]